MKSIQKLRGEVGSTYREVVAAEAFLRLGSTPDLEDAFDRLMAAHLAAIEALEDRICARATP